MAENRKITDAIEIMDKLYFDEDPEMLVLLDTAEINGGIAQHVYDLRQAIGWSRAEFAELFGVVPSVIEALEESAGEGEPLALLTKIEEIFLKHFEPIGKPAKTLYANALLNTTITGFKFRYFRYHLGRTAPLNGTCAVGELSQSQILSEPQTVQYLLSELEPWEHSLGITRNKLTIFARAGITEWCNLDGNFYITFTGDANEHIRAVDVHKQVINAFLQYLRTGERTALKQWRQDIGLQEENRYVTELEEALSDRTFAEFPDTEQLVAHLVAFVKQDLQDFQDLQD